MTGGVVKVWCGGGLGSTAATPTRMVECAKKGDAEAAAKAHRRALDMDPRYALAKAAHSLVCMRRIADGSGKLALYKHIFLRVIILWLLGMIQDELLA